MERFLRMGIECTLTMSLIAALLLLVTPILSKRYSAKTLYTAWVIVLMGFLIPYRPQPMPAAVSVRIPVVAREAYVPNTPASVPDTSPAAQPHQNQQPQTNLSTASTPPTPVQWNLSQLSVAQAAFVIWALGALVSLGLRLLAHRRFLRTAKRWGKRLKNETYLSELRALKAELGIRNKVGLYRCRSIDSPMLVGLMKPRILLPDILLSLAEVHLVLRHELIHLKRGDLWGRLLFLFASSLHWYNPLMIPISKAFSLACESSCDAEVLRGKNLDIRRYYGETILHSLRARPGVATLLSTRYRGGKQTMKKRILNILDARHKKLGAMAVALVLTAVLGAGMAFALTNEAHSAPKVDAQELTLSEQLNRKLAGILDEYTQILMTTKPELLSSVFPDDITEEEFKEYSEALDACDSYDSLVRLSAYLQVKLPDEEVVGFVWKLLQETSFARTGDLTYQYRHGIQTDQGKPTHYWLVAQEGGANEGAWDMIISGDNKLAMVQKSPNAHDLSTRYDGMSETKLTDAQRQAVSGRVSAFCKEYVFTQKATDGVILISDYAFHGLPDEDYALAWVFDDGAQNSVNPPYNHRKHDYNLGLQVAVGLESGMIHEIGMQQETIFVNGAHAEIDWVAYTGHEFPYPDDQYMWDVVQPKIYEMMSVLTQKYLSSLTSEEWLTAYHLGSDPYHLNADGDWKILIADLEACDSAEAFKAILHKEYIGINQAPAGEPTREEVLENARPMLDAIGYGDMTVRSFSYSSALSGADPGEAGYEILLMEDTDVPEAGVPQSVVRAAVSADGKLRYLQTPLLFAIQTKDITDADAAAVLEKVRGVAAYIDDPGYATADFYVSDIHSIYSAGVRQSDVFMEPDILMTLDMDTGRLYALWRGILEDLHGVKALGE